MSAKTSDSIIGETERLILRRFEESDLLDLFEYLSDAEVVKYEPYKPMRLEEVKENLKWKISSDEMVAVELKTNKKLIGNVYLGKRDFEAIEIGFVFNGEYGKQGYATESCLELIRLLFKNGVHRIFAECDPENQASCRLLERIGFVREAHLKKNIYFWKNEKHEPIWKDTLIYSKLNNNPDPSKRNVSVKQDTTPTLMA